MKIAINAKLLANSLDNGIARYAFNICKGLLEFDKANEYFFVSAESIWKKLGVAKERNLISKPNLLGPDINAFLFSQFSFSKNYQKSKSDLAFVPWVAPFSTDPTIVTVHDIVPLCAITKEVDAHHHRLRAKINFSLFAHYYGKKARVLIADSLDTKLAVVEKCKVKPENIRVIPLGVDAAHFYPRGQEEVSPILRKYSLTRPYFINIASTWQPRKNLPGLLEAFAYGSFKDADLVITGKKGPSYAQMQELILKHGLKDRVHLIEDVPYAELPALICGAISLVFPSFHEGFGLPVLEAMSCRCPVIASRAGALEEVGGDSALYVNPFERESIAEAMQMMADKKELRDQMALMGEKRAKEFTWERTARQTIDIFNEVGG